RAARMVDQVPAPEKARRMAVLQAIDRRKREAFARSNEGRVLECVLEWPADGTIPETMSAMADNYAQCRVETAGLEHRPATALLKMRWNGEGLMGAVV
ncbi:MAG TPA: hypothetical protein VEI97_05395, partial [bacterium]|nr:hypothetical protein [bacterium]